MFYLKGPPVHIHQKLPDPLQNVYIKASSALAYIKGLPPTTRTSKALLPAHACTKGDVKLTGFVLLMLHAEKYSWKYRTLQYWKLNPIYCSVDAQNVFRMQ